MRCTDYLLHACGDVADRLDRAGGRILHREDVVGDLLGGLGGLHGERFHLRGHHREAFAGFAGARRLDGGIERQKIGLAGDVADQGDDVADLLRAVGQPGHFAVGRARFFGRQRTMLLVWSSWRLISEIDCDNSSAATAAVSTLVEASLNVSTALVCALRGTVGGAEQRGRGRAHCGGAVADAAEQLLDARAERCDGGVDHGAPLLLCADRVAFFSARLLFGDVFMGRDPAAAGQRLVLGEHRCGRRLPVHKLRPLCRRRMPSTICRQ